MIDRPKLRYTSRGVEGTIESDFLSEIYVMTRVSELCKLRARPKIISAIVNGRTNKSLTDFGRMYKEVNGEAPPKGQLPSSPESIMNSAEKKLHGSFIIRKYIRLEKSGVEYEEAIFKAYIDYLDKFDTTPVDALIAFDNAYRLIGFYKSGLFNEVQCNECKLTYLKFANQPIARHSCPICATARTRALVERRKLAESTKEGSHLNLVERKASAG